MRQVGHLRAFVEKHLTLLLALILLLAITRLWIISLKTSFWVDEAVTVFVVHQGGADVSLDIAPQVSKSIYYGVARAADSLFGISEIGYRLPSILAMGLALLLIARLTARLIHPDAAWFAVFACLALKSLNTEAADARPYALGILVSAAALWFLVQWLDTNRIAPAIGFLFSAALLWRVHLLFWPVYLVFAVYAIFRLAQRETTVSWIAVAAIFIALAIALLPVAIEAVPILRQARAHVFVPPPKWSELTDAMKWKLLLAAFAIAGILDRMLKWSQTSAPSTWSNISGSSICLIFSWWLIHPVALFGYSRLTGNSVFIPRYLAIALPGAAMVAVLGAALFIPRANSSIPHWRYASLILGAGVVLTVGHWRHPWTAYANSDWRDAAIAVHRIAGNETPVICPSPFIEAKSPVWTPDYPLPGFLYSHLAIYPTGGHQYLFPFEDSPEADAYGRKLSPTLAHAGGFVIYGGLGQTTFWRNWFLRQPELTGWRAREVGSFGDVVVVVLEPVNEAGWDPAGRGLENNPFVKISQIDFAINTLEERSRLKAGGFAH